MHQASQAQKLVSVSATFTLVIGGKKASKVRVLNQVSCICYLIQFYKDKGKDVWALLNSKSEINAMTSAYMAHLAFKVREIIVGA